MPGNGAAEGTDPPTRGGTLLNRRSYLKIAGAAAASLPLVAGTASAVERHGIRFQEVVDMVADAGCDPTGEEPCDAKLRAAADDYTLLKFPEGEYFFREQNVIFDKTNLGLVGAGDVRFSVPANYNRKLLLIDRGTGFLFENIDVDLTAPGATPGLHFGVGDDLEVHDVELIGDGLHPDSARRNGGGNPGVVNALQPIVRSPSGTGRVRNFVAHNAGRMGAYNHGDGRVGVWIGISNKGTITLENCDVQGFPNNGLYCSRTNGVVRVEGGVFRNNDISQVRIGSEGSYVRDATIAADLDNGRSPNPESALNTRGVRLESGGPGDARGGTVRNCEVTIASTPNSSGGVVAAGTHGDFSVRNTRIRVDVDRIRGVYAKYPDGGVYDVPEPPRSARIEGVSVTGTAAGTEAIGIEGRDGSEIRNCCLHQEGASRDGVRLQNATDCTLRGSTLNVTGDPLDLDSADAATENNVASGTCPLPDRAPLPDGTAPPTPGSDDAATAPDQHALSIEGGSTDTVVSYRFAVSDSVEKSTAMGASIDDEDSISGTEVTGATAGGTDSFTFTGRITDFEADGGVTTYIDGEPIDDPTTFLPNTLSIEGGTTDTVVSYRFTASGPVRKSTARGASIDDEDSISDGEVTGATAGGTDSFAFAGSITNFEADGDVTVYRNGVAIDPTSLRPDTLTLEGGSPENVVEYAFSTDGTVEGTEAMGGTTNAEDSITNGNEASGAIAGWRDSYAVTGAITAFEADGPLTVYINGDEATPGEYLTDVLSIEGGRTDTVVSYSLTVGGYVAKSDANGASVDDEDTAAGKTATGALAGGTDSFAFSGDIEDLGVDGDATVTHNGDEIDPAEF